MTTNQNQDHSQDILCLGRIQRPKGLQGQIRVTIYGELLSSFKLPHKIDLYQSQQPKNGFLNTPVLKETYILEALTSYKPSVALIRLSKLATPEEITKVCGYYIGLNIQSAKEIFSNPDEPFLFEYIGLEVYDKDDPSFKGIVKKVEQQGDLDWLSIKIENLEQEVLIPLNNHFVDKKLDNNSSIAINELKNLSIHV